MIKAEVPWLQRNDLTRLDYNARHAAEKIYFNWIIVDCETVMFQYNFYTDNSHKKVLL